MREDDTLLGLAALDVSQMTTCRHDMQRTDSQASHEDADRMKLLQQS